MNGRRIVVLAVGLLTATGAFAHHAGAIYDREHPITVSGTVTEYMFYNPHVQVRFDGKDENGDMQTWVAVTGGPRGLFKVGWTRDTLKPGDKVTVVGGPSKDGKRHLSIRKLVVDSGSASGKILDIGAE